jgi:rubrerythrin
MAETEKIADHINASLVSRRAFMARMTAAGLGAAALALMGGEAAEASGQPVLEIVNIPDNSDIPGIHGKTKTIQVLNYALALETLEADIYRQALNLAAGKPLDTPLPEDTSSYTLSIAPGFLAPRNAALGFLYLQQFAAVEAAHRDFLRTVIPSMGGDPIAPNPGGYKADFGSDLSSILTVIRTVEETGVRAYLGVAQFINDFKITQTAASIYSTEARHSAAINYLLDKDPGPSRMRYDQEAVFDEEGNNNFEHWLTPELVLMLVKPFYA